MELLNNAKRKAQELKAKWDGLPEDARRTYTVIAVGGAVAIYFYNCGYNWAWKCAKHHYQEELEDILRGMHAKYTDALNGAASMEELQAAGRSGALMYEFVDFLGRTAYVGLEYAVEPQEKHTA